MTPLTPETIPAEVLEAYYATGLIPIRGCYETTGCDGNKYGCAMTALAESRSMTRSGLNLGSDARSSFANGFDGLKTNFSDEWYDAGVKTAALVKAKIGWSNKPVRPTGGSS